LAEIDYIRKMKILVVVVFCLAGSIGTGFSQSELKWHSLKEAMELNKKTPKKFFIDIYTDWCGWCKVMDKNTFQHEKISAIIDKYFYAVKFNAEKEPDEIEYKGKVYKLAGGKHELTAVLMNGQGNGYPTICYMDTDLSIMQAISGYQTPEQIEPILMYFGSGSHKTTPWDTYYAGFKSGLK
jgi:thioredoxin-related protein